MREKRPRNSPTQHPRPTFQGCRVPQQPHATHSCTCSTVCIFCPASLAFPVPQALAQKALPHEKPPQDPRPESDAPLPEASTDSLSCDQLTFLHCPSHPELSLTPQVPKAPVPTTPRPGPHTLPPRGPPQLQAQGKAESSPLPCALWSSFALTTPSKPSHQVTSHCLLANSQESRPSRSPLPPSGISAL